VILFSTSAMAERLWELNGKHVQALPHRRAPGGGTGVARRPERQLSQRPGDPPSEGRAHLLGAVGDLGINGSPSALASRK